MAGPVLRRTAGFTLIEIMVVMVIIAILGALIAPQILGRVDEARVTKAKQDIRVLSDALDLYRMENRKYPTTDQGLEALVRKPNDPSVRNWKAGGYVQRLSKDPWDTDYLYLQPGTRGGAYDLYSLGADGQTGGEESMRISATGISSQAADYGVPAAACRRQCGVTLIEILVVVVIIGVMAAFVTISIGVLGEDRELSASPSGSRR